jgi:hypothetical protein
MIRDFFKLSSIYDDCRRPRGGSVTNNSKKTLPAVHQRCPDAGFHRIHYDFHDLGANTLFMLFLQSPQFTKTLVFLTCQYLPTTLIWQKRTADRIL